MAKVLHFKGSEFPPPNIIIERPLQLRWADWESGAAILVVSQEAARFEEHRKMVLTKNHSHIAYVPNHLTIKDGLEYTLQALFRYRDQPDNMRDVYYLAGLMECLTSVPQPVLRTALVRGFYQTVINLKTKLSVNWHGHVSHFLFPLFPMHYNPNEFSQSIMKAETLKDLYDRIREGTEEQFLILGSEYVFYLPRWRQA